MNFSLVVVVSNVNIGESILLVWLGVIGLLHSDSLLADMATHKVNCRNAGVEFPASGRNALKPAFYRLASGGPPEMVAK